MGLIERIKEWFATIFARDPEEARRRTELRRLQAQLAELHPPLIRPKQDQVLPGFASAVFRFYSLLRPLSEIAKATVANTDSRVSQRYFDYLIDYHLPSGDQDRKRFFAYEGMMERIGSAIDPNTELENIQREFQSFLASIDALGNRSINADLMEVERFIDICRYDYERIIGLFDPSASLDDHRYKPDFGSVRGEQLLPELIDLYYLLESFLFSPMLKQCLLLLLQKRQPDSIDETKKGKIDKIFSQLDKESSDRLGKDTLLALIRVIKEEPYFTPATPRERKDYLGAYRRRLTQQFEKDRERILREQHESAIAIDIANLFGSTDIMEVEGYDDDHDTMLRKDSPNSFSWIKPLRILKTFITTIFEPHMKEAIKRVLVEGYFDNKGFQNNMANILYQCERSGGRIAGFEEMLRGSGRTSLVAMKRYLEELRRGKDIAVFLNRLVDTINDGAREIVEDETGLFGMLGDTLTEVLVDFRKSSPDYITNIRTLGGGRNKEIIVQLQNGKESIDTLMKVMRNFTYVKSGKDKNGDSSLEGSAETPDIGLSQPQDE